MNEPIDARPSGLLIDLDGTVLPENNRPTRRVVDAIFAASKLIPVAIASGRVQDDVCHFARLFGLTGPQVSDNGATLINPVTGRAFNRHILERPIAEQVISDLRNVASRVLFCDSGRFIENSDDITDWQISIMMAKFADESEARDWAMKYENAPVSAYATSDNLGVWYVDWTAAGIDKATGARDFSKAVGIDPSKLMVIGDGWNDVPMFEVAGTRIAMEGSPLNLLELATDTTPNIDHNGAAMAIEKYVLNR